MKSNQDIGFSSSLEKADGFSRTLLSMLPGHSLPSSLTRWISAEIAPSEFLCFGHSDITNQDANGNGIDDDDEGGTGRDGIANFGLDQRTAATADHTITDLAGYTMYYNIAVDQPLENMKTIRLIIVRDADQQSLVFDYQKAAPL